MCMASSSSVINVHHRRIVSCIIKRHGGENQAAQIKYPSEAKSANGMAINGKRNNESVAAMKSWRGGGVNNSGIVAAMVAWRSVSGLGSEGGVMASLSALKSA